MKLFKIHIKMRQSKVNTNQKNWSLVECRIINRFQDIQPKILNEKYFYPTTFYEAFSSEEAMSLIVNGFCREVMQEMPMEFAVEAQKLLQISLAGSVG